MSTIVDITIPVLNEEQTLRENVLRVLQHIRKTPVSGADVRIVIADNGSTDSTPSIASGLAAEHAGQVAFERVETRGVGAALKHAWSVSDAQIVGYMDLDLATDLRHLHDALPPLISGQVDLVYGSRLHRNSVVVGRARSREIISRTFNMLVRFYLGSSISDAMCGFKFLRREHLDLLRRSGAESDGWFFCAEFLLVAEAAGLRLLELPVTWTDDPESKVNVRRLTLEYVAAMRHLRPKLKSL